MLNSKLTLVLNKPPGYVSNLPVGMRNRRLIGHDKGQPQYLSVPLPAVLHNGVVLHRSTITFSYIVSTNQSPRLRIPYLPARLSIE